MGTKLLKVVFVVLLCCGGLAQAVPITIQITGNITSASGVSLPSTIHAGSTFTGTYTYDSAALDSDTNPQRGKYLHNSPYGISLSVGGYEFKTAPNHVGQFEMRIINDQVDNGVHDYYTVFSHENVAVPSSGFTMESIRWDLWDSSHTALSSSNLSVTAPVLSAWDHNVLAIDIFDSFGYGIGIKGTVMQVTPEPLTCVLMAMGILFVRRKQ